MSLIERYSPSTVSKPDEQATIGAVAQQVGYSTPFASSSAFKRAYGVSPNTHRSTASSSAHELGSSAL